MPLLNVLALVGFVVATGAMIALSRWLEKRKRRRYAASSFDPAVQAKIRQYHEEKRASRLTEEPRETKRLVLNPADPFAKIKDGLERAGYVPSARQPADEPTSFAWATEPRVATLSYACDLECDLRVLDIEAPKSALSGYVDGIVNAPGWLSTLTLFQLARCLDAADPRTILRGLRGAAMLGKGPAYRDFYERVAKLRAHADARIAAEAKRVEAILLAEAGGKPKPPGLRGERMDWRETGDVDYPFESERNGTRVRLRLGDFPAEDLYTLVGHLDGKEVDMGSFNDWPEDWSKPAKPKAPSFALPERADGMKVSWKSGMEHAPNCRFGLTTLVLEGDGKLTLEMRRSGRKSSWEGRVSEAARARLLDALRAASFPSVKAKKAPAPFLVPGQTIDDVTVIFADGRTATLAMDANDFRHDPTYGKVHAVLESLSKQVSGGKVGYGDDMLGAGAVEQCQQTA